MSNFNRKIGTVRENKMKKLERLNTVTELKTAFNRLDTVKERVSELKNRSTELPTLKQEATTRMKQNEVFHSRRQIKISNLDGIKFQKAKRKWSRRNI